MPSGSTSPNALSMADRKEIHDAGNTRIVRGFECKNLVVQKSSEPCKLASWSEVLLLRHAKAQVTAEFHDSILSGECDISIQDFVVFFVKTAGAPSEKHTAASVTTSNTAGEINTQKYRGFIQQTGRESLKGHSSV